MESSTEIYPIPEEIAEKYNSVRGIIEDWDYHKAKATLESILEEAPDHPRVLVLLATVYWLLRNPRRPEYLAKAEGILVDVIERFPGLAIAHSYLGILYFRSGRRKEAAHHAQIALKLEPRTSEEWNTLGFYYALSGNYTKALDFFLFAYTVDPSSRVAAYNISGTYAKLGKTEAALEYLEYALKSRRLLGITEKDNDFNSLRDLPRYKELIAEAKQRFGIK